MAPIARPLPPAAQGPCEAFVVDARRARRLRFSRTPRGSLHVDELDRLGEAWDEKQHGRPSMLAARGRSYAGIRHEREERRQRFARDVALWLQRQVPAGDGAVTVFCAQPLLGALRKGATQALLRRVRLREGDLGWLNRRELSRQKAIDALLPLPPA
jgi:hypothetical protein